MIAVLDDGRRAGDRSSRCRSARAERTRANSRVRLTSWSSTTETFDFEPLGVVTTP